MSNLKINLRIAENWSDLPDVWKSVVNTQKAKFEYNLKDKKLISLFEPFFSLDVFSPALGGLHIDERSMVASDTYKLIHLINVGGISDGTYIVSEKVSKQYQTPIGRISDKYPIWKNVIESKTQQIFSIDALKLKTYCEAVKKGKYLDKDTKSLSLAINTGGKEKFTVNAEYLIDTLNVFLKLGKRYLYVGYNSPSKAIYFSPDSYAAQYPLETIGASNFILLMPQYTYDKLLGAEDVKNETAIKVYYCLEDDTIRNHDDTIATFDYNLKSNILPYIKPNELNLLKKLVGKNPNLPICDYIYVKDNEAVATDVEQAVLIYGIFVEDGVYEIVNDAFKDTIGYNISDFPHYIDSLAYYKKASFDLYELNNYLQEAKNYVSIDDDRKGLKCISYIGDENNNVTINASNAQVLFSKQTETKPLSSISIMLKNPFMQSYMLSQMEVFGGEVGMYIDDRNEFCKFIKGNISYITEAENEKTINFKVAIPKNTNSILSLDKDFISLKISELKGEEAKNNIIFKFDKEIENADDINGSVSIFTTKPISVGMGNKYVADRKICNLNYEISAYNFFWDDYVALIMPRPNERTDELEFAYNDLETILNTNQTSRDFFYNNDRIGSAFLVRLSDIYPMRTKKIVPKLPPPPVSKANFSVGDKFRNATLDEIITIQVIPPNYTDYVLIKNQNGNEKLYRTIQEMNDLITNGVWVKIQTEAVTRESVEAIIKMYQIKAKRGDTAAASIIKMYQVQLKRL